VTSLSRDTIQAIQRDILGVTRLYEKDRRDAEAKMQRRMRALHTRWLMLGKKDEEWQVFLRETLALPKSQPDAEVTR